MTWKSTYTRLHDLTWLGVFLWLKVNLAPGDGRLDLLSYRRKVVQNISIEALQLASSYSWSTRANTNAFIFTDSASPALTSALIILITTMSHLETRTCCGQYHKNIRGVAWRFGVRHAYASAWTIFLFCTVCRIFAMLWTFYTVELETRGCRGTFFSSLCC